MYIPAERKAQSFCAKMDLIAFVDSAKRYDFHD
jgi:hypothetical protein